MTKHFFVFLFAFSLIGVGELSCRAETVKSDKIKKPVHGYKLPPSRYFKPPVTKGELYRGPYTAEFVEVRDGDSIIVRAHVWPTIVVETEVRVRGIDAPEYRNPKCPQERSKGAKAAFKALTQIRSTPVKGLPYLVELENVSAGKYAGRVIADVFYLNKKGKRKSLSQELLKRGLVRPYFGGKKKSWCAKR